MAGQPRGWTTPSGPTQDISRYSEAATAKTPQLGKSITNIEEVLREIEKEPALSAYTYRLEMDGLISTAENSYGVLISDIDPEQEVKVTAPFSVVQKPSRLCILRREKRSIFQMQCAWLYLDKME